MRPVLFMAICSLAFPAIANARQQDDIGIFPTPLNLAPVDAPAPLLCGLAASAAQMDTKRGNDEPVDPVLWNKSDSRTTIDCRSEFKAARLRIRSDTSARRVTVPRRMDDGRYYVEIISGCANICLGGDGYAVRHDDGRFITEAEPITSWMR